ncbi:hypothetical protein NQ317_002668 [Molorchus minor]|uniref:Trichoplein keratin filament-binding protein n=1 Tax=Molorchus minor TaxID=1323400 RepID=A0ABQ9JK92_9CUCU|nr:hypothetical protein NQ317_002668 [Molorchus minor]
MSQKPTNSKLDEIPTEEEEEIRRKREAESKLFDQWRRNNPVIRQFESKYKTKDLKLSWLDQQIEKQMQKEREEEQARRVLKERDEKLKKAQEYEERFKRELREKEMNLKEDLKNQMEQLRKRQDIAEELRRKEDEELRRKIEINDIAEKQKN